MKAKIIEATKINNIWTFHDTDKKILQGNFCNGSDVLLDKYVKEANKCWIMFSKDQFPETGKLSMTLIDETPTKVYYSTDIGMKNCPEFRLLYYKRVMKHYFDEIPKKIYYKIFI